MPANVWLLITALSSHDITIFDRYGILAANVWLLITALSSHDITIFDRYGILALFKNGI
jgi:hypothetical protein